MELYIENKREKTQREKILKPLLCEMTLKPVLA